MIVLACDIGGTLSALIGSTWVLCIFTFMLVVTRR